VPSFEMTVPILLSLMSALTFIQILHVNGV
jgi:hypothetical protein